MGPGGGASNGAASGDGAGTEDALTNAGALTVRGAFERDLLTEAEGRTAAGFGRQGTQAP